MEIQVSENGLTFKNHLKWAAITGTPMIIFMCIFMLFSGFISSDELFLAHLKQDFGIIILGIICMIFFQIIFLASVNYFSLLLLNKLGCVKFTYAKSP